MMRNPWLIVGFTAAVWAVALHSEILPECGVWRKTDILGQAKADGPSFLVLYLEKMGGVWVRSGNLLASEEECRAEETKARAGGKYQLKSGCRASRWAQWFLGEWINCGALPLEGKAPAELIGTQAECLKLELWSSPTEKSAWQGETLANGREVLLRAKAPSSGKKKNLQVQFYGQGRPLGPALALSASGQAALRVKLPAGRSLYSAVLFQDQAVQCFSGTILAPVMNK